MPPNELRPHTNIHINKLVIGRHLGSSFSFAFCKNENNIRICFDFYITLPNHGCKQNSYLYNAGAVMAGWIPVFDTMHGIRGEVNIVVKVDLFSDVNKFRQSSCGVKFFHCKYHEFILFKLW